MAIAMLDVTGLSNSQVSEVDEVIQTFLREKYKSQDIEVDLQDQELDEEDEEDEEE